MINETKIQKSHQFQRWLSLRTYNVVISCSFFLFYCIGSLQSYSHTRAEALFNLPAFIPLCAMLLCAYLVYCLVKQKDQQCMILMPILALFTTLFITINSHFEPETSLNSFLYFSLLLPLFYSFLLCYHFQLLVFNKVLIIVSYTVVAIVGDTSTLVFIFNLIFLLTLTFLTIYTHIRNINYMANNIPQKTEKNSMLGEQDSHYLKSILHDIRQPLSSLSLYAHLLKESIEEPKQRLMIENLMSSSAQLDHWLSSLLELATLNTKNIAVTSKNIPIEVCLSDVIKKYQAKATLNNMELKTRLGKLSLYTDSRLVSDIIDNLLSNALVHGEQKQGTRLLLTARKQHGSTLIQVWNKGKRINSDMLDNLFDEFDPGKTSASRKSKGPCLGLVLSQKKASLLNTKIQVTTSDNGSCFSIIIPKGVAAASPPLNSDFKYESHQHILLVDDDESILTALAMLLSGWGYTVDCADNSAQAMQLLDDNVFSLIISDYRLPGTINGIDLIKAAKQKQNIASLLLTGDVHSQDFQEKGCNVDRILHKPIKPAALRLLLRQLLND